MGISESLLVFRNPDTCLCLLETGMINLDDSMGGGIHWICYRNVDKQYCGYFDPFGLIMPNEIKNYLKTSGKKMVYSSDEIQERDSVLFGYWCL